MSKIRNLLAFFAISMSLAGCHRTPAELTYASVRPNLDMTADRAICEGEMYKSTLSSTPAIGHPVDMAFDDVRRNYAAKKVLTGCMVQHGYVLTTPEP